VSINVPLLLIILFGKSTICVRLNVFIRITSFNVSLLFIKRFTFKSPQIKYVTFGCRKWFRMFSYVSQNSFKFPNGALKTQKTIGFVILTCSLTAHISNVFSWQ
jgi:hypothetical protein